MKQSKKKFFWTQVANIVGGLTLISIVGGGGYGIGRWVSNTETKMQVMELDRKHYEEITNQKDDYNHELLELMQKYNNQILSLENEIKILKYYNLEQYEK